MTRQTSGSGFGGIIFRDRVNFIIDGTSLRTFSMSEYAHPRFRCDWGQNYHNIATALNALDPDKFKLKETMRLGCSVPRPADAPAAYMPAAAGKTSMVQDHRAPERVTGLGVSTVAIVAMIALGAGWLVQSRRSAVFLP
jgi:hypothetical protein